MSDVWALRRAVLPPPVALADCSIERSLGGSAELVRAAPRDRTFPTRVSETLGFCLKSGATHEVHASGRAHVYPRDALCIRTPGCVWSTASTGVVGFVSLDLDGGLLPDDLARGLMTFAPGNALPELGFALDALVNAPAPLARESALALLIERAQALGVLTAPSVARTVSERRLARARECIEANLSSAPTLAALSELAGLNRFALVRQFRARYGATPHALSLLVRVEHSKRLLGRGARASEVASELGFADQAHFARAFKRVVGLSPSRYARAVRAVASVKRPADQFHSRRRAPSAARTPHGEDTPL